MEEGREIVANIKIISFNVTNICGQDGVWNRRTTDIKVNYIVEVDRRVFGHC